MANRSTRARTDFLYRDRLLATLTASRLYGGPRRELAASLRLALAAPDRRRAFAELAADQILRDPVRAHPIPAAALEYVEFMAHCASNQLSRSARADRWDDDRQRLERAKGQYERWHALARTDLDDARQTLIALGPEHSIAESLETHLRGLIGAYRELQLAWWPTVAYGRRGEIDVLDQAASARAEIETEMIRHGRFDERASMEASHDAGRRRLRRDIEDVTQDELFGPALEFELP